MKSKPRTLQNLIDRNSYQLINDDETSTNFNNLPPEIYFHIADQLDQNDLDSWKRVNIHSYQFISDYRVKRANNDLMKKIGFYSTSIEVNQDFYQAELEQMILKLSHNYPYLFKFL